MIMVIYKSNIYAIMNTKLLKKKNNKKERKSSPRIYEDQITFFTHNSRTVPRSCLLQICSHIFSLCLCIQFAVSKGAIKTNRLYLSHCKNFSDFLSNLPFVFPDNASMLFRSAMYLLFVLY